MSQFFWQKQSNYVPNSPLQLIYQYPATVKLPMPNALISCLPHTIYQSSNYSSQDIFPEFTQFSPSNPLDEFDQLSSSNCPQKPFLDFFQTLSCKATLKKINALCSPSAYYIDYIHHLFASQISAVAPQFLICSTLPTIESLYALVYLAQTRPHFAISLSLYMA